MSIALWVNGNKKKDNMKLTDEQMTVNNGWMISGSAMPNIDNYSNIGGCALAHPFNPAKRKECNARKGEKQAAKVGEKTSSANLTNALADALKNKGGSGMSTGAIVGIIAGVAVLGTVLVLVMKN